MSRPVSGAKTTAKSTAHTPTPATAVSQRSAKTALKTGTAKGGSICVIDSD